MIMDAYVLPSSLRISHDTWGGFLWALVHYPEVLRPAALWRRVQGQGSSAKGQG